MSLYSTLTEEEIGRFLSSFGIAVTGRATLLSGGSANTNYLVPGDTGKYILSVCEAKSAGEVEVFVNLLAQLERSGFRTNRTFPTVRGRRMLFHKGKPVILKSFLEGRVPTDLTTPQAFELGVQMARLHAVPAPAYLPRQHAYDISAFGILKKEAEGHPFVDWIGEMKEELSRSVPEGLSRGLIHGDIFCDNLVISDDHLYIIDFEEACVHYLLFDLGMAVVGTCCPQYRPREDLIRSLLEGYLTVGGLSEQELGYIELFAMYAAAGTAFWRFRQFNVLTPNEELSSHYQKMAGLAEIFRQRIRGDDKANAFTLR